jgi:membrane protein YdbS with pleckstrin-like domain
MPFPRRLLIEDEELVLDLRPHWIALALPGLITVLGLIGAWWLARSLDSLTWLPWVLYLGAMLVYPLPRLVWWLTSNFAVTSDRVIHREGFIAKRSMEIPLEAINDVRFSQSIFGRIVGAGTLVIQSASEQGRQTFEDIRHPEQVQRTIYLEGEKNKRRMYQGMGAGSPPAVPSVTTELERLAELRVKGILSEEEFQQQKARILGQE